MRCHKIASPGRLWAFNPILAGQNGSTNSYDCFYGIGSRILPGVTRVAVLLITVTLIAGTTPLAARMATAELPPMLIPLVRFGTAGVLLALTAHWLRLWKTIPRRLWPGLAGLGLLCVPINQLGYLIGVKKANASHAGIAYALVPVLVFWITIALRRAHMSIRLGSASLLAFAGAALVSLATQSTAAEGAMESGTTTGDLLLISAATSWSLFVVLSQPFVKELGAVVTLCIVFLVGTLWHIPVAAIEWIWFRGDFSPGAVSWQGWAGLAFLTFITAYLNFLLWYIVTSRYDLTRSAVVTNAHFVVTVILEAVFFEQNVGPIALLGSLLLMAGIVLATRQPKTGQV